jgi:hypothetical protein
MGKRTEARRQILEQAHDGHETYRTKARVKRVGPRRWLATSEYGYDYLETIRNWRVSRAQLAGFLVTLIALVAVLLYLLALGPHLP